MTMLSALSAERRAAGRQRAFLQGRIVFNHGKSAFDCTIRDLSPTGARIQFSDAITVPQSVVLEIPSRSARHEALVRWRSGDKIGIEFQDAAPRAAEAIVQDATLARIARLEDEVRRLSAMLERLAGGGA